MPQQNPIQQFKPQQPGVALKPQKLAEPEKKKHTVWWIMGSCCAILIIIFLVLAVLSVAYWGRVKELANKVSGGIVGSNTTTYENAPATNNTVTNITNTTNTPSNNTVKPTNSTGGGTPSTPTTTEKNVMVSAVTAKGIDTKTGGAKDVTSVFSSSDTIYYVVMQVSNLEKMDVSVDWYLGDEKVQTYVLKDTSGNKFVNFYLDVSGSDASARVGDYQAKIYFGTTLKKTLSFSVTN